MWLIFRSLEFKAMLKQISLYKGTTLCLGSKSGCSMIQSSNSTVLVLVSNCSARGIKTSDLQLIPLRWSLFVFPKMRIIPFTQSCRVLFPSMMKLLNTIFLRAPCIDQMNLSRSNCLSLSEITCREILELLNLSGSEVSSITNS